MNAQLPPAGWHPDPEDKNQWRYWDGSQWTEHRAPRGARSNSAPTPTKTASAAPLETPASRGASSAAPPGPAHMNLASESGFVGWVKRHKVMSGFGGAFVVLVLIGALGSTESTTGDADTPAVNKTASDKDGDGVPNKRDAFPADPDESADKNKNGRGDNADAVIAEAKAQAEEDAKRQAEEKAAAEARQKEIDNAPFPSEHDLALVFKDPDSHVGEEFKVWGQVFQFDAATGTDSFLAQVANRNTMSYGFFDGENALFTGDEADFANLVEDDLFIATVSVAGSESYDTQIGGNTTVPSFEVLKITPQ